jgi:hypothetical protein
LVTRHTLFGPQGDGSHGFCGGRAVKKVIRLFAAIYTKFFYLYTILCSYARASKDL